MTGESIVQRFAGRVLVVWVLITTTLLAGGCEVDTFLDQSMVGRWERTPIVLPILSQLDMIDDRTTDPPGLRKVLPTDLIAEIEEYFIDEGDLITISIFQLMVLNTETVQTRRVDELGTVRLPVLGRIKVAGFTVSQLEEHLAKLLEERGILKDPTVSVVIQEGRAKTFSVVGDPRGGQSQSIGTYQIIKSDFRLMDALALSGAGSGRGELKRIYIIRQIKTDGPDAGSPEAPDAGDASRPETKEPADLIEDLLRGLEGDTPAPAPAQPAPEAAPGQTGAAPPPVLESSLDDTTKAPYVNVDGQWKRVDQLPADSPLAAAQPKQIVIEVPYDRLMEGDLDYNVVIRPGDIIRFPPSVAGNVFLGGAIGRPGTFALPGDKEMTLKQLVFAAGGLAQIAFPERVDLIRRLEDDQEVIVRLNLRGIFEGTQPDFYLKPNDTIHVGTSFAATFIAIARNGFRLSYGFAFVFDKNFSDNDDNNN